MSERPALRALVFVIGGVETAVVVGMLILLDPFGSSSDQLTRSIAVGVSTLLGVPYVALVVPALVLAALDRYLPLALALTILAIGVAFALFRLA
jgi:hypothetical protein